MADHTTTDGAPGNVSGARAGASVSGMPLTWLEDGDTKPFAPAPESDVTWLDELGDQAREHGRDLRKARRERRDGAGDDVEEGPGLTWV